MKFSVITVCFNAGDKLIKTIENALQQTYDDFEVLVKDGGSKDGSVEKLQEEVTDSRVRIVIEPDKGIYDAMNHAVKMATGDYCIFLNCGDSFYSIDVLEKVALKNLPLTGTIAYGDTYFVLSDSVSKAPPVITGSVCYRNIPCHQAIFYSRDTLLTRGFDTSLKIRADFEHFAYSFFKAHTNFIYLDFTVCHYEGGGFSETKANKNRDRLEYKKAVKANIPTGKRFLYRLELILTFHKIRGWLARNPQTAKLYQKLKERAYR